MKVLSFLILSFLIVGCIWETEARRRKQREGSRRYDPRGEDDIEPFSDDETYYWGEEDYDEDEYGDDYGSEYDDGYGSEYDDGYGSEYDDGYGSEYDDDYLGDPYDYEEPEDNEYYEEEDDYPVDRMDEEDEFLPEDDDVDPFFTDEPYSDRPISDLGMEDFMTGETADASEIPEDYFAMDTGKQKVDMAEEDNGRSLFSPDLSFPGFQIHICTSQWWKARKNVCITKEKKFGVEKKTPYSYTMFKCFSSSVDSYTCNISQSAPEGSTEYSLTYKCCNGYTRKNGDWGCPRKQVTDTLKGLNFTEALKRKLNYTATSAKDLYLSSPMNNATAKLWTVFVPEIRAFQNWTKNLLSKLDERVVIDLTIDTEIVKLVSESKNRLFNHFVVNKSVTAGSLVNEQLLKTKARNGQLLVRKTRVMTLVNCVPIIKSDIAFNNDSVMHITKDVVPLPTQNLYELVSQRLSHFKNSTGIQKVLQQMKSQLSDSNTVTTMFLYVPRDNDEISSDCFSRFLKFGLVKGMHCYEGLKDTWFLYNTEGKKLKLSFNRTNSSLFIQGTRINETETVATNGVLHIIDSPIFSMELDNELYRKIKTMEKFKALSTWARRNNKTYVMLLPPYKGGYNYTNFTQTKSDEVLDKIASKLVSVNNSVSQLTMVTGEKRRITKILKLGPFSKPIMTQYVDCVEVKKVIKSCDGCLLYKMSSSLPNFTKAAELLSYIKSNDSYRTTYKLLKYIKDNNVRNVSAMWNNSSKVSVILLTDVHMKKLIKEETLTTNMKGASVWFVQNFIRSFDFCAVKQEKKVTTVRTFSPQKTACTGLFCYFSKFRLSTQRVTLLLKMKHIKTKQGFLIPGIIIFK